MPPTKKINQGRSRWANNSIILFTSNVLCRLDGVRRFVAAHRPQARAPLAAQPDPLTIPDGTVVGSGSKSAESESRTLCTDIEGHIREAELLVFSYVESFGCTGLDLKLSILDLKTRAVELKMRSHTEEAGSSTVRKLTEMVHEAREDVIAGIRQDRCTDIELRIKVLDLETRVVEKRKMLEGNGSAL